MNATANRDTGDEQTTLFEAPGVCPVEECLTTRRNLCLHDADIAREAKERLERRPRGCIAAPDPKTDPFPDGF